MVAGFASAASSEGRRVRFSWVVGGPPGSHRRVVGLSPENRWVLATAVAGLSPEGRWVLTGGSPGSRQNGRSVLARGVARRANSAR